MGGKPMDARIKQAIQRGQDQREVDAKKKHKKEKDFKRARKKQQKAVRAKVFDWMNENLPALIEDLVAQGDASCAPYVFRDKMYEDIDLCGTSDKMVAEAAEELGLKVTSESRWCEAWH